MSERPKPRSREAAKLLAAALAAAVPNKADARFSPSIDPPTIESKEHGLPLGGVIQELSFDTLRQLRNITNRDALVSFLLDKYFDALSTDERFAVLDIVRQSAWSTDAEVLEFVRLQVSRSFRSPDVPVQIVEWVVASMVPPKLPQGAFEKEQFDRYMVESKYYDQYVRWVMSHVEFLERAAETADARRIMRALVRYVPTSQLFSDLYHRSRSKEFFDIAEAELHGGKHEHSLSPEEIRRRFDASEGQDFFFSSEWLSLRPEDQEAFIRAQLWEGTLAYPLFVSVLNQRYHTKMVAPAFYREMMARFAEQDPESLLRACCFENDTPLYWTDEREFFEKALMDGRTTPEARIAFVRYARDTVLRYEDYAKLLEKLPAPDVRALENREPGVGNSHETVPRSIYNDPALARYAEVKERFLPADVQLSNVFERTNWILMVTRNLHFRGFTGPIDASVVREEVERIQRLRESFSDYPLFGATLLVGHEEMWRENQPRFLTDAFLQRARAAAESAVVITPHRQREGWDRDFVVTAETLRHAHDRALSEVRTMPRGSRHFTFVADGHGWRDAVYLSEGQIVGSAVAETNAASKLTVEDLSGALIQRYRTEALRAGTDTHPDVLVLGSCYSSNIGRGIIERLRAEGMPVPIILMMADFDQYGYSDRYVPEGGDFQARTILQVNELLAAPTVGGAVRGAPEQELSRPVIIVPDKDGVPVQISENDRLGYAGTSAA